MNLSPDIFMHPSFDLLFWIFFSFGSMLNILIDAAKQIIYERLPTLWTIIPASLKLWQ